MILCYAASTKAAKCTLRFHGIYVIYRYFYHVQTLWFLFVCVCLRARVCACVCACLCVHVCVRTGDYYF